MRRGHNESMREENAVSRAWGHCSACGYNNAPDEFRCEKCGRRLQLSAVATPSQPKFVVYRRPEPGSRSDAERGIHVATNPQPAPDVNQLPNRPAAAPASPRRIAAQHRNTRRQISDRVQAFRFRRSNPNLPLQFGDEERSANEPERQNEKTEQSPKSNVVAMESRTAPESVPATSAPAATLPPPPPIERHRRRAAAHIDQPEFDFPIPEEKPEGFLALPVAPFRLRLLGHGMDLSLTLAAFLLFLIPFKLMLTTVAPSRMLLVGMAGAYLLLVLLYGLVFICLAGATPTMKWMGLRLVNFDGAPPGRRQLFFRFLGAITSVGSFFLGFLWALADEEKLAWHDRISKTFLTVSRLPEGQYRK